DRILGEVAAGLFDRGVRKFVVAGGETSGQVIKSLGIRRVEVSGFDELGGGYCHQAGSDPVSFVLKAGALGKENFCFTALERMRLAEEQA
ncbi:MAG: nucleotide-binding domain containing protein, partial [Gammaproteobacteria bacterium]